MKKIAVVLVFVPGLFQSGVAQVYKKQTISYLDASGAPSKEMNSSFLQQRIQLDDSMWEFDFYRTGGHRLKSFQFNDGDGNRLNGRYVSYNLFGVADTIGSYENNRRAGRWSIFTTKGRLAAEQLYENGELLWTKDTVQLKQESDSMAALKDSGIIFTKVEKEAEFPGGAMAWHQ
jgi:hypothetical protein